MRILAEMVGGSTSSQEYHSAAVISKYHSDLNNNKTSGVFKNF